MAIFTSWTALENYLNTTSDKDLIINLNMTQEEASNNNGGSILIKFPNSANSCVLSSSDNTIIYNARITTNSTRYFELTINDLSIKINETNNIIDVAKKQYRNANNEKNYNKLNFSGTNSLVNDADRSIIHVINDNGLYINLMPNSSTTLRLDNPSKQKSAIIGGNSSDNIGENGGNIFIEGSGSLELYSSWTTGIGGGFGYNLGGNGGNIAIYGDAQVAIHDCYTGIGGGFSNTTGGAGGDIDIYGNTQITITNSTTGIGGGSGSTGGIGGNIDIYGNTQITISDSVTGIGAGAGYIKGGNGGNTSIYEDAQVTIASYLNGIGGGNNIAYDRNGAGGNAGNISILDNSKVTINLEDDKYFNIGVGIGVGCAINIGTTRTLADLGTGTGNIIIKTVNPVTITANSADSFAIALGLNKDSNIEITSDAKMNLINGIQGGHLTIKNQKLIVNKLIYKYENSTSDTGSLIFDTGYIVVNNLVHEEYPTDRGDYFDVILTKDGVPYTSEVRLESINNDLPLWSEADNKITPNADGTIQIYISNGDYYFYYGEDGNYYSQRTEVFPVDGTTTIDAPLPLDTTDILYYGNVKYIKNNNTTGAENIIVALYDENKNLTQYGTMTDKDGNYSFSPVDLGTYYVAFINAPNDYLFVVNDNSAVMQTGVTKIAYSSLTKPAVEVNAELKFNESAIGFAGIPGRNGLNFPSSSINTLQPQLQLSLKGSSIDLGQLIEGTGNSICYSPDKNSIILNNPGTYMINYKANARFINEHSSNDYLGLQLKLGDNYINHGFSYIKNDGVLYGFALVRNYACIYAGCNELQIINVGSQDMYLDNLEVTVFRAS